MTAAKITPENNPARSTLASIVEAIHGLRYLESDPDPYGENPEAFEQVSRIIKQNGGDIISVGIAGAAEENKTFYFFRLKKCDIVRIADAIAEHDYEVVSVIE